FPTQQGMKTWRAEFTPLLSQLTQTGSDLGVVLWFRLVPATAPAQPDNHTGPSLAEQEPLFEMDHDVPPGSRRYHFFERTSLIALFSSMVSASICFSFLFSSSSCFSRLASETSMPPYLVRQL